MCHALRHQITFISALVCVPTANPAWNVEEKVLTRNGAVCTSKYLQIIKAIILAFRAFPRNDATAVEAGLRLHCQHPRIN